MDRRGKVGRRLSGLWHNHFIRLVGMVGKGKVGKHLGGFSTLLKSRNLEKNSEPAPALFLHLKAKAHFKMLNL